MDPKKRRRRLQELGVGIVVVVAIALLAAAVMAIGRENRLFVSRVGFRTTVTDASGVRVGSPVTMAGVRIGSVDDLVLPTNPAADGITVHLSIDRNYAARVREGTEAKLQILQFVSGEKIVALTPGDPQKPALRRESDIPVAPASPLLEQGKNIAETVGQITEDLKDILGAIRNGQGLVGKAIVDPNFSREALDRLGRAIQTTSAMLERMNHGEGLVGRMVADRQYADRVSADLATTAANLAETSRRLAEGQGVFGQLTTKGPGDDLVGSLAETARSLRDISAGVQQGNGLAGLLLTDRVRAERIAAHLDETAANLASITRKVDAGQGTLGLLVNDRALHDNANQLVSGMRQSRVLSWIIRRFHNRGAETAPKPPDGTEDTGTGSAAPGHLAPDPAGAPGKPAPRRGPDAGPDEEIVP